MVTSSKAANTRVSIDFSAGPLPPRYQHNYRIELEVQPNAVEGRLVRHGCGVESGFTNGERHFKLASDTWRQDLATVIQRTAPAREPDWRPGGPSWSVKLERASDATQSSFCPENLEEWQEITQVLEAMVDKKDLHPVRLLSVDGQGKSEFVVSQDPATRNMTLALQRNGRVVAQAPLAPDAYRKFMQSMKGLSLLHNTQADIEQPGFYIDPGWGKYGAWNVQVYGAAPNMATNHNGIKARQFLADAKQLVASLSAPSMTLRWPE